MVINAKVLKAIIFWSHSETTAENVPIHKDFIKFISVAPPTVKTKKVERTQIENLITLIEEAIIIL